MDFTACNLVVAILLLFVFSCEANKQCNANNLVSKGALKCASRWWTNRDASQIIDFHPNMTTIATAALKSFKADLNDAKEHLSWLFPNDAPLSKKLESVLLVEPYFAYLVADLISGFGLTSEDLIKLKLPLQLANRTELISMYENYFKLSCIESVPRQVLSCLTRWMAQNCDAVEDKTTLMYEFIFQMMDHYCIGGAWKNEIKSKLNLDFGTVYADVAKYLGISRNPNSPVVFSVAKESFFGNVARWNEFKELFKKEINGDFLKDDLYMWNENFTAGAGHVFRWVVRAAQLQVKSFFQAWNRFDNFFMERFPKFVDHITFMAQRYSIQDFSVAQVDLSGQRAMAEVVGNFHIITYNSSTPSTCITSGVTTLIGNRFFKLSASASPLCTGCMASRIDGIQLSFRNGVNYRGEDILRNSATKGSTSGKIKMEKVNNFVRITDGNSGAVLIVQKYRDGFIIISNMAQALFEESYGVLVTGCLAHIDTRATAQTSANVGRQEVCNTACSSATASLKDSCIYDCIMMDDAAVADLYRQEKTLRSIIKWSP